MARRNRTVRGRTEPRHIRMYHWMMNSSAWHDLSAVARAIYCEMAKRYYGVNNGRIPYSVRDAAVELRISKATASRALQSLQDHGFIVKVTEGAFSLKTRHATEWRLTQFPCDVTGAWATKDFMRWQRPPTARPSKAVADDTTGRATALFNGARALSTETQSKGNNDADGRDADHVPAHHTLVN